MLIHVPSVANDATQAENAPRYDNGATLKESRPTTWAGTPSLDITDSNASLVADPVQIQGFICDYIGRSVQLVAIKPDAKVISARHFDNDPTAATAWAVKRNAIGFNLYWSVNEVAAGLHSKASKPDITAVRMLHVDIDPKKDGTPFDKPAAISALSEHAMPPSFIVDSGGGLGAFWVLDEPVTDIEGVEAANRGIEAIFGGDHCHNVDRVMRLVGTVNWPDAAKRSRGRDVSLARIAQPDDGVRYAPYDILTTFAASAPPKEGRGSTKAIAVRHQMPLAPLTADDLDLPAHSSLRSVIDHPAGHDRNRDVARAASDLLRAGYDAEKVIRILCTPANAVAAHCLAQSDPRRAAARAVEFVTRKADQGDAIQAYLIDGDAISFGDLEAILPEHKYVYTPTGALWPAASVNGHMPSQFRVDRDGNVIVDDKGKPKMMPASEWLDKNKPCTQVTWCPGMPQIVEGMLFQDGAWVTRAGERVYNEYRPAPAYNGDAALAQPFIDHVFRVYPEEADHILQWAAYRVQKPQLKINHALVLGGGQGIGKDTILAPIVRALGEWNCAEVSPATILGRFNGFAKSVLLRVSEASDLGDSDRFAFYEHLKTLIAAPPDSIRIDQKHRQEYMIPNVCGVVITTNHKTDGIHLEPDDRRHFVCWSDLEAADLGPAYFQQLYAWLEDGGYGHVAAYLHQCDVSQFDPKSPPRKTTAFWAIVDAGRNPDDAQMRDIVEHLRNPLALTIADAITAAREVQAHDFADYLGDRKNARKLSFRFEGAGYVRVTNDDAKDGCFKVNGRRTPVYAQKQLATRERIAAAMSL